MPTGARLVQLDCQAGARAYEQDGTVSKISHVGIQKVRHRHSWAVQNMPLRPRQRFMRMADEFWKRHIPETGGTLGIHLRGTDKSFIPVVRVMSYLPVVRAFMCHRPNATIFIATDDSRMLNTMASALRRRHPRTRLVWRGATRGHSGANPAGCFSVPLKELNTSHPCVNQSKSHVTLGEEVMMDTLLLSRADYLIKSLSSVSEFSLYLNPLLINNSYDINLLNHPLPEWHCACGCDETGRPSKGWPATG